MNVFSLGAWLTLCQSLDIATIPARSLGRILVEDIYRIQDHEPGVSAETIAFLENYPTQLRPTTILRWDYCAPENIKYRISKGRHEWTPLYQLLVIDDIRLCSVLDDCGRFDTHITVWERPWVSALIDKSYPIEFRVFAQDGRIQGCSNYFPQRDLEHSPEVLTWCAEAMALSERFLPTVRDFTADWMVTTDGLRFLEGGPPHHLDPFKGSAHPCCFAPGHIEGIALAPQPGALRS